MTSKKQLPPSVGEFAVGEREQLLARIATLEAAAEKAGHLIEQMAQAIGANDEYGDFAAEIEAAEEFAGELINMAALASTESPGTTGKARDA